MDIYVLPERTAIVMLSLADRKDPRTRLCCFRNGYWATGGHCPTFNIIEVSHYLFVASIDLFRYPTTGRRDLTVQVPMDL